MSFGSWVSNTWVPGPVWIVSHKIEITNTMQARAGLFKLTTSSTFDPQRGNYLLVHVYISPKSWMCRQLGIKTKKYFISITEQKITYPYHNYTYLTNSLIIITPPIVWAPHSNSVQKIYCTTCILTFADSTCNLFSKVLFFKCPQSTLVASRVINWARSYTFTK